MTARRAVLELSGHGGRFENRLAPLASRARAAIRARYACGLANDLSVGGIHIQPVGDLRVRLLLDERARLRVAEFGLRLTFELWLTELDGDDDGEALANVIAREVGILSLSRPLSRAYLIITGGQSRAKTFVRTALGGVDRVGERGGSLSRRWSTASPPRPKSLLLVLGLEINRIGVNRFHLLGLDQVLDVIEQNRRRTCR